MPPAARPGVGGNRRAGLLAGGAVLLTLGLGVAIILNLLAHLGVPAGSCRTLVPGLHICDTWGWYATVVFVLGIFASLVGAGMIALGQQLPASPLRVFDTEGAHPPDPAEP